ncbi:MAG TPA: methyltransferase domain-containing protein [Xanthomonadaceae bacterium]|nr:methyltransferase domain-containing protein [Xanthomonadaceae bacterium]
MRSKSEPRSVDGRLPDTPAWTFFRQWLKHPLSIAAISPSSRQLARQMLAELPAGTHRVVELGGGTGVFTQAMIASGIAPKDLLVLELNQELHHHLHRRFPEAHICCADARDLSQVFADSGYGDDGPADAVISGLGLLSMARPTQQAIVESAFSVLRPGGRLILFTYGPVCPVAREVRRDLELSSRRGKVAWWNMPPATVYVLTRNRSRAVAPRRGGRVRAVSR